MKMTPLRDFEKYDDDRGAWYEIPKEYEPYEIKKVNEIRWTPRQKNEAKQFYEEVVLKHNLKETDKVVIKKWKN